MNMDKNNQKTAGVWLSHGKAIALAMGFFTRLPTWHLKDIYDEDMGRALLYFPLVGLAVGITSVCFGLMLHGALLYWHGAVSMVHLGLIGALVFAMMTLITGGLHLDGVGDCADAWVGGLGNKERTLEIMKDPTCGPMAVLVLVVLLLLKMVAVVGLVLSSSWWVLLSIPILSRCAGMALFMTTDYVRPKGLGQAFSDYSKKPECSIFLFTGLTAAVLISGFFLIFPALITAVVWWWLRRQSIERLGGFTGDVAGGVIEVTEMVLLVTSALLV
ncbi:adenosylcobinamide-GDP ribazoletransferase [Endozoicomonas ascidiicola]|uniref:adenosylcobinamide-GDP ribazoletransferase n=1 Tax=Endozoicomonas ascidiicola TaxID=1698521 RepID=UPI0008368B4E|nr:adenosylcobinamide-GDP ribazoletransferase [Endozoicomonas ascidiicola]